MHFLTLILVVVLAVSLARIATRAIAKDRRYQFAQGRAAGRIEGRSEKLSAHNALQQENLQTLVDISTTLNVANKFWLGLPGTEPYRLRVVEHMKALGRIATRIKELDQAPSDLQREQEKAA
jgi:hypothetical protein